MSSKDHRHETFVEWVLALLDERFSWLGKDIDDPVSGADTVDSLVDLHRDLTEQRNAIHRNEQHTDQ